MDYDKLIAPAAAAMRPSGIRKFFDLAAEMPECISLGVGEPDFKTPWAVREAGIESLEHGRTRYTSNAGLKELRAEIARYLDRRMGLKYDPAKEVLVTVGGSEAIDMCIRTLVQSGDEVIIPEPCFVCYEPITTLSGGVPVHVACRQEDEFRLRADALKAAITPKTKLILINSPQNPTGTVYPRETLQGIADLAIRHDLIVVSDEINEKIIFDGEEHISIASLPGMRERTVVLNGFSKAYAMTGSRIGYAAGPERLIAPIYCAHQYSAMCPCTYAQWGAVAALRGPQGHIADMVKELDRRRLMLLDRLAAMPGVSFVRPQGAFYIMVSIPGLGTPMQAAEFLLDAGLAIVPWDEEHLRISYANSYENLSIAMDRMEKAGRSIVEAVEANPAKAKQVRRFANYYLPDAVNILQQYATLARQGVKGENAAAIRTEVEHNAASIATAFENQLDALYAAESMDLSADLTVLQNMLKGQGL